MAQKLCHHITTKTSAMFIFNNNNERTKKNTRKLCEIDKSWLGSAARCCRERMKLVGGVFASNNMACQAFHFNVEWARLFSSLFFFVFSLVFCCFFFYFMRNEQQRITNLMEYNCASIIFILKFFEQKESTSLWD